MIVYVVHGNTYYDGYGHVETYLVFIQKKMLLNPLKIW